MAVSVTAQQLGETSYRVECVPDVPGALLYWYVAAVLSEVTARTWRQFEVAPGEILDIEVLDDADAVPQPSHPSRWQIHWETTGAAAYAIDEWVTDAWVERQQIRDNGGQVFRFLSRVLEDGQAHKFRVRPIGANGETGVAFEFEQFIVRTPDPIDVSYTLDTGTRKVLIEVAA
jgi:hypothetical protein